MTQVKLSSRDASGKAVTGKTIAIVGATGAVALVLYLALRPRRSDGGTSASSSDVTTKPPVPSS